MDDALRHDWLLAEARAIHDLPLPELLYRAQSVHRQYHETSKVQLCTLLSIKTGGCPEDCAYCPQSAHHDAGVDKEPLMDVGAVLTAAKEAKDSGASRFCMGAAWRDVRDGEEFDSVCEMIRGVTDLGMESCVTLGMLDADQAKRLADAGLKAYNHNLDTSREYYPEIISTRTYDERLQTLQHVRNAGVTICSGGIIGLGESIDDRCSMLIELANLPVHPESVPVNTLVAVSGTPLADAKPVESFELVRMIATARILMPASIVRLSAGRTGLSDEAQVLCFMAGANSVFYGEKLLTTGNPDVSGDRSLMESTGITPLVPGRADASGAGSGGEQTA